MKQHLLLNINPRQFKPVQHSFCSSLFFSTILHRPSEKNVTTDTFFFKTERDKIFGMKNLKKLFLRSFLFFIALTSASPSSSFAGYTWVRNTTFGSLSFWSMASSLTGQKLVGVPEYTGYLYTSADGGTTWIPRTSLGVQNWFSVASSSDGTHLVAVTRTYGASYSQVYTSTNSGTSWTLQTGAGLTSSWMSVASSYDGMKLVLVGPNSCATSINGGVTWTSHTINPGWHAWWSVASSSDGTHLAVVDNVGGGTSNFIYTSSNSGATWVQHLSAGSHVWLGIASSADGTKLTAVSGDGGAASTGHIYLSNNSGLTWTPASSAGANYWYSVSSSADGSKLIAGNLNSGISMSTDSGVTWVSQSTPSSCSGWEAVVASGDGTHFAADDGCFSWNAAATIVGQMVVTSSVTSITATSAVLKGYFYDSGSATSVGFEYGPSTSYSSIVTLGTPMSASGSFSTPVTGLTCGTFYHFRAYATKLLSADFGADLTFVTLPCPAGS